MATVTKRDLVVEVTNISGLTHQQASDSLDALVEVLTRKLQNGERVSFRRFGTFSVKVAKAKKGRNPKTPDVEIVIPERCALRFKPCLELRQAIRELSPAHLSSKKSKPRKA
jgi:nucleoid DNA-binding protein